MCVYYCVVLNFLIFVRLTTKYEINTNDILKHELQNYKNDNNLKVNEILIINQKKMKFINVLLIVLLFAACNNVAKNDQFVIKGKLKGIKDGAILWKKGMNDQNPKEFKMLNGEFIISGKAFSEPTDLLFEIKDKDARFGMYVEKGEHTFSGELKMTKSPYGEHGQIVNQIVTGCEVNQQVVDYRKLSSKIRTKYDIFKAPAEKRNEISKLYKAAIKKLNIDYVTNNKDKYYASYIAARLAHGQNAQGVKKIIDMLDPKLDTKYSRGLKEQYAKMKETDVDPSKIIKAKNVKYAINNSFDGKALTNVKYLGIFSNDNVCALTQKGEIIIVGKKGEKINSFIPKTNYPAASIAVDTKDRIVLLIPQKRKVERKFRGKLHKIDETYGHVAKTFDTKGNEVESVELKGVLTASGARVIDNQLLVADWQNRVIGVFDLKTGKRNSDLKDMRPCCMILDFSVNAKKEVLVANLGAFRVNAFNLSGKKLLAFGKRGRDLNSFHGCCNPVSVAYLSNGAIVTVEKSPTRVKVFSNEGAKKIQGIDELVKGCTYIPMIVDSKDNLYLASPKKGMIKCSAVK